MPGELREGTRKGIAWFHVDLAGRASPSPSPSPSPSHASTPRRERDHWFSTTVDRSLAFFGAHKVPATYFVVGHDLDDPGRRAAVQRIVAAGHHIGSLALAPTDLTRPALGDRGRAIADERARVQDTLGVPCDGFRAPGDTIDVATLHAVRDAGYAYDSSLTPSYATRRRLGVMRLWTEPFDLFGGGGGLLELPLPFVGPWLPPFAPPHAFTLPRWWVSGQLRRFAERQRYLTYRFAQADFAPGADGGGGTDSRNDGRRRHLDALLTEVRSHFPVLTTSEQLVRGWPASAPDLNPRTILGIATTHETGACIVRDGDVVAAVNEERMSRVKLDTSYPPRASIREAIRLAGIDPTDVDAVAVAGLRWSDLLPQLLESLRRDVGDYHALNDYIPHFCRVAYRLFYLWRASRYGDVATFLESEYGIRPKVWYVEHHEAHAACAHRTGLAEHSVVVTADGVGDDVCLTVGTGTSALIERHLTAFYPNSFGQFYTACTQILGFKGGRHEGKITGLAGFGERREELVRRVESTFFSRDGDFRLNKRFYAEGFPRLRLKDVLGGARGRNALLSIDYRNYKPPLRRLLRGFAREDVAWTFQHLLEREVVKLVRPFVSSGVTHLTLAGGVFANVKLNMALSQELQPASIYIYPNMGDGGLCTGAALTVSAGRPRPARHMYLGTSYDDADIAQAIARYPMLAAARPADLPDAIATALADQLIVARFAGAMEFGPRALGHRSILYHAGDRTVNAWLNERLNRTEFMPFAPMCIHEDADAYFHLRDGERRACEFMTLVVSCTDRMRDTCPAAVHVDGTARPQLVRADIAPQMHEILLRYRQRTGSSVVINTSFNMHEEPIIRSPDEAIRSFLQSNLHVLALGPFLVSQDAELLARLTTPALPKERGLEPHGVALPVTGRPS